MLSTMMMHDVRVNIPGRKASHIGLAALYQLHDVPNFGLVASISATTGNIYW